MSRKRSNVIQGILLGACSVLALAQGASAATVQVVGSQINIQWDYVESGQSGFNIFRKAGTAEYAKLATVGPLERSYADPAVTPSITYCYKVQAIASAVESDFSNEDCGVLSTAPSPTPSPTATVTPSPTPSPTVSPSPSPVPTQPAVGQTLFTTQKPASLSNSDGATVNYELGMKFVSSQAGQITAIRFYKSASERGTHVGKIYSAAGTLLAQVTFSNETASGWQTQKLATPLSIAASTRYVVSVNTGSSYYVATTSGLASQVTNGALRSVVGSNGVYGPVGKMPASSWQNSNYFRDVMFVPKQ